jgi:hypothetical protein
LGSLDVEWSGDAAPSLSLEAIRGKGVGKKDGKTVAIMWSFSSFIPEA